MKITLITSNLGKVKEFKAALGDSMEIDHVEHEYDEIQGLDPEIITKDAAKRMAEKFGKAVVVEDSGLFIEALNGFPGTMSKFVHKKIGLKGLLTLLEKEKNRNATYKSAVGYCEPGKEPISFLGEEQGTIAMEKRGSFGFGHDPIFIPEGSENTYGEQEGCENLKKFRRNAVLKLKEYLGGKHDSEN